MSRSESESSATSKEDNSVMYKREFDLEDEEHSSEEANTLDNNNVEAYQDEPLADEEWLNNYTRETEQDQIQQQENMQRMRGEVPLDVW